MKINIIFVVWCWSDILVVIYGFNCDYVLLYFVKLGMIIYFEYFYSVIILEVWLIYGNLGVGWKIGFVSFERSLLIEFIFNS